jgi:IPT/TIG domain
MPHHGHAFTLVVIVGDNLSGATAVDFGTEPAMFFQFGDKAILALAPPQPKGTKVDVTVTTPNGTSPTSKADRFRYSHGHHQPGWGFGFGGMFGF